MKPSCIGRYCAGSEQVAVSSEQGQPWGPAHAHASLGHPGSSCSLTPCMCSWLCWRVNVSVDLHRDHRDNSTQSCIEHQQQLTTAATAATTLLARVLRPAASTTRLKNPISRLYRAFSNINRKSCINKSSTTVREYSLFSDIYLTSSLD